MPDLGRNYGRRMTRRAKKLDPAIVASTPALLVARIEDGVARQEVSGPHGLDAESARQYLRGLRVARGTAGSGRGGGSGRSCGR